MNLEQILENQRRFFAGGATLSVSYRIQMLRKLYQAIQNYETRICEALTADLGKSDFEGFMCEAGLVLTEIRYMIRHTRRFAKEHTVPTPLAQFASRSYRKPSPYGTVLIMSPWNYPFLLTMEPLVDAIAAGNTAIVKPSAYSPATSAVIAELIAQCFSPDYVACVTGGRKENTALLEQRFDLIFFTGSQGVGKEVLKSAAEHLTPVILELGGKSPCIVDATADLKLAARRIVFGKFLNCGQTCVAPDYLICDASVKDRLLLYIREEITKQFGPDPLQNTDYGHIVNEKHFNRLLSLIQPEKLFCGGTFSKDRLQLAPTVLDRVDWEDPVMQEEIFGPILPVLTYDSFDMLYSLPLCKQKPLALYLFSSNKKHIADITSRLSFGGGCINDVVIHLATSEMGFGGVGESGMGSYHGKTGFEAFSHTKSIVDKKTWLDLPMRYQPYQRKTYGKLLKLFLR